MLRAQLAAGLAALVLFGMVAPAVALPPGGTFFDDDGLVHEGAIEAIAAGGITVGCDELGERFCPDRVVTRAEMATFLVRALGLTPQDPVRFGDAAGVHRGSIGAVEAVGWFKGCNPPDNDLFCPDDGLTRGQAAVVLVRAFDLPAAAGSGFVDDDGSVFEDAIGALAAAGVTRGCDPPVNDRFCPDRVVTRGEVASFLARALDLEPVTPDQPFEGRIALGLYSGLIVNGGIAAMEGTRIPRPLLIDSLGDPALSPDGETVAYFDFRRECPADATGPWDCYRRILTMPFAGGEERQITPNASLPVGLGWLPDGQSIGFVDARDTSDPDFPVDWYLARVEISQPLVVEDISGPAAYASSNPDWSVTGDIVVEAQNPMEDVILLVLDADGDEKTAIAVTGRHLLCPRWSPDGTMLAYVAANDEDSQLVISATDGSHRKVIATAPDIADVAWSPDGSTLAYVNDLRAWAISVTGGDPWPLTPLDVPVIGIDWGRSPD